MSEKYRCVLTIAGSDPSAGAGIQADLKTFSALGCYGLTVITALTAQNTLGVQAVKNIAEKFVLQQLESIFQDIDVLAVKIGMLHNEKIIKLVTNYFKTKNIPLVLDPVMLAKNGNALLKVSAVSALKKYLLPMATLITPNIPEAEILLNEKITNEYIMEQAAKKMIDTGIKAVLIKGGHLSNKLARDCLLINNQQEVHWFESSRINTKNTHGTGCTLSAAIAAYLAHGMILEEAIAAAKAYLFSALKQGAKIQLGHGHGPVNHFWRI